MTFGTLVLYKGVEVQTTALQNENLMMVKQILLKLKVAQPQIEFAGNTESYILVKVNDLEIYLYHDGEANLIKKTNGKITLDKRFEIPDYSDTSELMKDLLDSIEGCIH